MSKKVISEKVKAELPERMLQAADRFYFAAILTCLPFDAAHIEKCAPTDTRQAAELAISGPNRSAEILIPPVALFAFSIELYFKFLIFQSTRRLEFDHGHNLLALFNQLERCAPEVAEVCVASFRYGRDRTYTNSFLALYDQSFERWRYAYEFEKLEASADNLMCFADSLREAVNRFHSKVSRAF